MKHPVRPSTRMGSSHDIKSILNTSSTVHSSPSRSMGTACDHFFSQCSVDRNHGYQSVLSAECNSDVLHVVVNQLTRQANFTAWQTFFEYKLNYERVIGPQNTAGPYGRNNLDCDFEIIKPRGLLPLQPLSFLILYYFNQLTYITFQKKLINYKSTDLIMM
jgi:hypothetical protein